MKITISGTLGSGKTTVAKILSQKLGYKLYSTGQIARKLSEEMNMPTFMDTMKLAEKDSTLDKQIDAYQKNLGQEEDNFVLEGRLGFHFIPDSVKVYLKCDEKIAAERVLKGLKEKDASRIKEGLKQDVNEIIKSFHERRNSENKRYSKLYGITQDDEQNFDLVIDTTSISPEEVCSLILGWVAKKHNKK